MIQKSQMSYPPYENASQMPKTIVPTAPTPVPMCPTLTTGAMRIVPSGVSVLRIATIRTQKTIMPATYANALRRWSGEDPAVEGHAGRSNDTAVAIGET